MVFRGIIDAETRAYVKYLTKHEQISTREIIEKTGVSRATIYRIKKEKAGDKSVSQKRRRKGGRPTKLDARDERQLLRSLKILRKEEGQFSSKRLMEKAGIQESQASNRTINQSINQSINQLYLKHGEIISIFTKLQEELKIYIQDNHR